MNPWRNISSNITIALVVFAVVALLHSMFAAVAPMARPPPAVSWDDFFPAAALFAAFAALLRGAIALDRWACRHDDADAPPAFDVMVPPKEDEPDQ